MRGPVQVIGGLVALELGATLAKSQFALAGVAAVVALRLTFAAAILGVRFRLAWRRRRTVPLILGIGGLLAIHHLLFYAAVYRLPLGAAVTIEFCGPLVIALTGARRLRQAAWALLAGAGVAAVALAGPGRAATGAGVSAIGLACAAGAGVAWSGYILTAAALGRRTDDGRWLAPATAVAAAVTLPIAVATAGTRLLDWHLLFTCLVIALLCEVLSYSLQNSALRGLTAAAFSVLTSLEPVVAAILGLLVLGQRLSWLQVAGIAAVVMASAGHTLAMRDRLVPSQPVTPAD